MVLLFPATNHSLALALLLFIHIHTFELNAPTRIHDSIKIPKRENRYIFGMLLCITSQRNSAFRAHPKTIIGSMLVLPTHLLFVFTILPLYTVMIYNPTLYPVKRMGSLLGLVPLASRHLREFFLTNQPV